jgi:DNA ligase-1
MFRPLLAPNDLPSTNPNFFDFIKYPLLVSPKLDGIRGIVKNKEVISRSLKPLRSFQVQELFKEYEDYDGELIIGKPNRANVYHETNSHVMSFDKPGDIYFYVFDYANESFKNNSFENRLNIVQSKIEKSNDERVICVPHRFIESYEELMNYEQEMFEKNYEGLMLRNPKGIYKHNRATMLDNIIFKLKQIQDSEHEIIGFVEGTINTNEQTIDERGLAKRSSKKEGLVPSNTLGKFIVDFNGEPLNVSCGNIPHKTRDFIWANQDKFINKYLKVAYMMYGIKDLPRQARAKGFRDKMDFM